MNPKKYKKFIFKTSDSVQKEILSAWLTGEEWEGIEETAEGIAVYTSKSFTDKKMKTILNSLPFSVEWTSEELTEQNWNKLWESQFNPLYIENKVYIRAGFHPPAANNALEIIIDPKMSFGTGHHATTELMIKMLLKLNPVGKTVIDMGTGTGILAILAEKLGATRIFAIDNDRWSYENAKENIKKNHCRHIEVYHGDANVLKKLPEADIILANINRNILLQDLPEYARKMIPGGKIFLSGILTGDEIPIRKKALETGLTHKKTLHLNEWIGMEFVK